MNEIIKGTSAVVTGTIVSNLDVGFKPTATVFTLYERNSKTIINSRNNTDITSSVAADGTLTHSLAPADNAMISATADVEIHVIRYKWTYNTTEVGIAEFEYRVKKDTTPTS